MLLTIYKGLWEAPQYFCELLSCKPEARYSLRSVEQDLLAVSKIHQMFGDRGFARAGPARWNSLPHKIRCAPSAYSVY